ncbi:MAG: thiamine pyrophosphate-binding protein, partial [Propionibacteriaceae bacterium]|nr:thiamine pyrophosphate-binding protein [Propionibacteriaceae bacterium]
LPLPAGSQAAAEDDALGSPARIDNASAGALDDLGATAGGDRAGADPRGDLGSTAGLDRAADGLDGHSVAAAVWSATARAQQPLVIGSSHPIRDLDLAPVLTTAPPAYANRGLAGIDGTIATALGVALASGPTTLLVGDLTFLHDAGSLLIGPLERRPDLRIVVVNDDGGSIFHILEQGAPEHADAFERIFGTPTGANLAGIAAGYGWRHRRITSHAQLIEAIAEPVTAEILEVRVSRAHRRAQATAVNKMA